MNWTEFVKYLYERKIYADKDVAGFVKNGQLSADDYKDITGKEYSEK